MELSDREYRVVGMALMLYATSEVHQPSNRESDESWQNYHVELADRAVAKELYCKFLSASAGVK